MRISNVPSITPRYWAAILVASMCGANTGDFLSHNLHLGHTRGLLPLALLFLAILWIERLSRWVTEAYYWLAIIVLRTAATNLADLGAHDLKLGYDLFIGALTVLLIVAVAADRGGKRAEVNAVAAGVPATTPLYWLAMLTAGTLGTAGGDFIADEWLGLFYGAAILTVIYAATLAAAPHLGGMAKPWYWASIVVARTAGTILGDLCASRRGLNLGLPLSTALTATLLAGIIILWPRGRAPLVAPSKLGDATEP